LGGSLACGSSFNLVKYAVVCILAMEGLKRAGGWVCCVSALVAVVACALWSDANAAMIAAGTTEGFVSIYWAIAGRH
jgi:hypothetical protein